MDNSTLPNSSPSEQPEPEQPKSRWSKKITVGNKESLAIQTNLKTLCLLGVLAVGGCLYPRYVFLSLAVATYSVIFHEAGHLLVATLFRYKVKGVGFGPFNGHVVIEGRITKRNIIVTAAAGPVVNILFVACGYYWFHDGLRYACLFWINIVMLFLPTFNEGSDYQMIWNALRHDAKEEENANGNVDFPFA